MDEDLLIALNPGAQFAAGEQVAVAAFGPNLKAVKVARLEADKAARQLRGYDMEDRLVVAYPATIGSESNPSPSGTHVVAAVAPMPNYTYDPDVNFQQGENTDKLIIPPGPNGPVGTMWIDLTEPTFGIHGTPEPSRIDKTASHGCVRLTNWDAEELAAMVEPGVPVVFLD
jgi:lipoprotein-anchoring transpeptidase ErfK/SrfK